MSPPWSSFGEVGGYRFYEKVLFLRKLSLIYLPNWIRGGAWLINTLYTLNYILISKKICFLFFSFLPSREAARESCHSS